jgi:hypothetical protein
MNKVRLLLPFIVFLFFALGACEKDKNPPEGGYTYYEVGFQSTSSDWRDTSFVVRTKSQQIIQQIETQLTLPVEQRQLVVGALVEGSGGYNYNASHEFKWHFKEDDWNLADMTIEIYDGKPYTDVDLDFSYWLNTVKRFGAWGSYIKRKLPGKP